MAVYSSRKRTEIHHEWTVPAGSNHAEFLKAYNAACLAYREAKGYREEHLSDDALWINVDEDCDGPQIVISFTTEERT